MKSQLNCKNIDDLRAEYVAQQFVEARIDFLPDRP